MSNNSEYKVLNLYACLGGNRYKWENCQVTAVENDPELARLYQDRFPNDIVIIGDAHEYLRLHYDEYDFIWSSPPCPSHSKARYARKGTIEAIYPDMRLYEEILFLQTHFNGKYCVENVIPYYEPLIPARKRGRHLYWTNFPLPSDLEEKESGIISGKDEVKKLCKIHDYDFYQYNGAQRIDKIARNLVDYEVGLAIFNQARGIQQKQKTKQQQLF
jgi:DNA (cytosine-5)-methyltransferase 1